MYDVRILILRIQWVSDFFINLFLLEYNLPYSGNIFITFVRIFIYHEEQ